MCVPIIVFARLDKTIATINFDENFPINIYLYLNITFHKLSLLRLYMHSFCIIIKEQNMNSINVN